MARDRPRTSARARYTVPECTAAMLRSSNTNSPSRFGIRTGGEPTNWHAARSAGTSVIEATAFDTDRASHAFTKSGAHPRLTYTEAGISEAAAGETTHAPTNR